MAVQQLASLASEAAEHFVLLEFADQSLAHINQRLEFVCFGSELLDEPQFGNDAAGFIRQ